MTDRKPRLRDREGLWLAIGVGLLAPVSAWAGADPTQLIVTAVASGLLAGIRHLQERRRYKRENDGVIR